jgi:hypothetical protein
MQTTLKNDVLDENLEGITIYKTGFEVLFRGITNSPVDFRFITDWWLKKYIMEQVFQTFGLEKLNAWFSSEDIRKFNIWRQKKREEAKDDFQIKRSPEKIKQKQYKLDCIINRMVSEMDDAEKETVCQDNEIN